MTKSESANDNLGMDHESLRPHFENRRILIGISGGIAVYKVCTLVSRLAQAGAQVTVAMTESATRFVTPMTFEALSANPVYASVWDQISSKPPFDPQHIALARGLDLAVVAPCTANTLANLVQGRADDAVSLILAAINRRSTPVLLAPAMNTEMWDQPATQRNVAQAQEDGFGIIGPGEGWQACRAVGMGRMAEPEQIAGAMAEALGQENR